MFTNVWSPFQFSSRSWSFRLIRRIWEILKHLKSKVWLTESGVNRRTRSVLKPENIHLVLLTGITELKGKRLSLRVSTVFITLLKQHDFLNIVKKQQVNTRIWKLQLHVLFHLHQVLSRDSFSVSEKIEVSFVLN